MATSFAGVTPREYDTWRETAEFHVIEKETILPLLPTHSSRVLDLGCGTGTWTRLVASLRPEAEIVGVDLSEEMIEFARETDGAGLRYLTADCCAMPDLGSFDLVVCGMSVDYISFPCITRAVAESLSDDGVALVWVLDPSRYPIENGERVKQWVIGGQVVHERAPVFDPLAVCDAFRDAGLSAEVTRREFVLSDGVKRTLICYALVKATS